MTTASDTATEHTEPWCDTKLHVLPVPPGQEDPGCHRIIQVGGIWWMIHRIGRRIVFSDSHGESHPEDVFRDWLGEAGRQLEYIPRQRSA